MDANDITKGTSDWFSLDGNAEPGSEPVFDNVKGYLKTDFNEDLMKLDVPTLIIHDEDDHSLPIDVSARVSAKPVRDAVVKAYHGSADRSGQDAPRPVQC